MWPGWREVRVRNASGGTYVGLKGNKSKEFRMALQKEKREKKRIRNTLLFNTWTGQKTSTGSRHARGREKHYENSLQSQTSTQVTTTKIETHT